MNFIKLLFTHINSSFFAGYFCSVFIYMLAIIANGVPQELSNYTKEGEKNVNLTIKYLANGDLKYLDEENNEIKLSDKEFKQRGPVKKHQSVSFLTLTNNLNNVETKIRFLEKIIPSAHATSHNVTYETHITKQDGVVVSCKIHKITPSAHKFYSYC